jgi:hypothetical protein
VKKLIKERKQTIKENKSNKREKKEKDVMDISLLLSIMRSF